MKNVTNRVAVDPIVLSGKAVIVGTRIPVYLILELLGSGLTEEEVLFQYPTIKRKDVKAALFYAARRLEKEGV